MVGRGYITRLVNLPVTFYPQEVCMTFGQDFQHGVSMAFHSG